MPVINALISLNMANGQPKKVALTNIESTPVCGVLIKKPEILVFNDGLSVYDEPEQLKIKNNIARLLPNTAILWLTGELNNEKAFDRVINLTENA